jgi:pimeloyl-ACP methyl ester carboxylesterase
VTRTPPSAPRQAEVFGAFATSSATRREAVVVTASFDPALTSGAASAIEAFEPPVRLVWGTQDELFPPAHGERLLAAFPNASLVQVPSSSTYVMLDAPDVLAREIRISAGSTPAS